jgi:cytochrome c biogenesis protein
MLPVDMGDGVPVFLLGVRSAAEPSATCACRPTTRAAMDGFMRLRRPCTTRPSARAVQRYVARWRRPARPERAAGAVGHARAGPVRRRRHASTGGALAPAGDVHFMETGAEAERERAAEVLLRILNGSCSSWRSWRARRTASSL